MHREINNFIGGLENVLETVGLSDEVLKTRKKKMTRTTVLKKAVNRKKY